MEYISVQQAAENWGVSVRRVQVYLKDGRVSGAVRLGRSWMIPSGAGKPANPRAGGPTRKILFADDFGRMIETTIAPMPKNDPDAVLDSVSEDRQRLHFEGELAYLRGDFEQVIACFQRTKGDDVARLRACSLTIAAAISTGEYSLFEEIETFLKGIIKEDMGASITAAAQLSLDTAFVGAVAPNMVSDMVKNGDLSAIPDKVLPDAIYRRAKYFHCVGKFDVMLATAQTGLAFCRDKETISLAGNYLLLSCAIACRGLGRMDEAENYLTESLRICLPHGFITPFVEAATALGEMLGKCLAQDFPEYRKVINGKWQTTFANWMSFHNHFTKDNITSILSLRNYEIAQLASYGMPYAEIAKRFGITEGRLKNILSGIYDELFISGKKELSAYIL